MIRLLPGDCREVLRDLPDASVHCCVTDPPYELAFMGRRWDSTGVAFCADTWREVLRVLKPGGHLVAFGGTRTSHRMACAIEDAGFEIRDTLCWLYGSGFPKSHDVSKAIDAAAGAVREVIGTKLGRPGMARDGSNQRSGFDDAFGGEGRGGMSTDITAPATPDAQRWQGWGTALKPAHEPIILARKPLQGTVAQNVLAHGTGAINVDACRIHSDDAPGGDYTVKRLKSGATLRATGGNWRPDEDGPEYQGTLKPGRWPPNVCHDGSDEVEAAFAAFGERTSGEPLNRMHVDPGRNVASGASAGGVYLHSGFGDTGSASRFFYSAKATAADRADSRHPTVKPIELMRWLVRLVCPPGGTVLDPFAGSGTTGEAAMLCGFDAILIEQDAQHVADIRHRMVRWSGEDMPLFASPPPASDDAYDRDMRDLFAEAAE